MAAAAEGDPETAAALNAIKAAAAGENRAEIGQNRTDHAETSPALASDNAIADEAEGDPENGIGKRAAATGGDAPQTAYAETNANL